MPTHVLKSAGLLLWTLGHALLVAQAPPPCTIDTFAGGPFGPFSGDGGPAIQAEMVPNDIAFDAAGNMYISDGANSRIRIVTPGGIIQTYAGTGKAGGGGDGGPAHLAELYGPSRLRFDSGGNLYVIELAGRRVRKISVTGIITTIAGKGTPGFGGDGGPATDAAIDGVGDLVFDGSGNIYLADRGNNRIRKISPDGRITTIAGNGVGGIFRSDMIGDGGPAAEAVVSGPSQVQFDGAGNLYVFEASSPRIRKISPQGIIQTIIGTGDSFPLGDEKVASPAVPIGMANSLLVASDGTIFFDQATTPSPRKIVRIALDNAISEVGRYPGAWFVWDRQGRFHALGDGQVFLLGEGNTQTLLAGLPLADGPRGDGGPASQAFLGSPRDIAAGQDGRVYIVQQSDYRRLRVIDSSGLISSRTVPGAGNNIGRISMAVDHLGNLYFAWGGVIEKLTPGGTLTVIRRHEPCIGSSPCPNGIDSPSHLQVDSQGDLYFLEGRTSAVKRLRVLRPDGLLEQVRLANGTVLERFPPENGGPPEVIAIDPNDNLLIGTTRGIWRVTPSGEFSEVPGTVGYIEQDHFASMLFMTADAAGNIYFAPSIYSPPMLKRVTPQGDILTITGSYRRTEEYDAGDGGPAAGGLISYPTDIAIDHRGDLLFVQSEARKIRRITKVADCDSSPRPQLAAVSTLNGASMQSGSPSPGGIMTIFGKRLGPENGVRADLSGGQPAPLSLGGTRVLFDGVPSPVLYASANQVNFIAPYAISLPSPLPNTPWVRFEVEHQGITSEPQWGGAYFSAPGIFTLDGSGRGQGAILNQDLTINGASNPARPGEIVVIYATGAGQTDPPGVDGQLAIDVLPKPILPVSVKIGGIEAEIKYAGAAPLLVAGVLQVNAVVPPSLTAGGPQEVLLQVDDFASPSGVTVAIKVD